MKLLEDQSIFNENRDLVRKLIQHQNNEPNSEIISTIEIEILLLSTSINNAKITFRNDTIKEKFNSDKTLNYLKNRIDLTSNKRLKLRYYYLIWNSIQKHHKFLKPIAEITNQLLSEDKFDTTNLDNYLIVENYIALFHDKEQYKIQTISNATNYLNSKQQDAAMYKLCLLEFIYDIKKFKLNSLEDIDKYISEIFDYFIKKHHILIAERILNIALQISNKLNIDHLRWHDKYPCEQLRIESIR